MIGQLAAAVVDAGTYPDRTERRHTLGRKSISYEVEKGGWIDLLWEALPYRVLRRRIHVTRARALQEMAQLARDAE